MKAELAVSWEDLEVKRREVRSRLAQLDWAAQRREAQRGRAGIFFRAQLRSSLHRLHQQREHSRRANLALSSRIQNAIAAAAVGEQCSASGVSARAFSAALQLARTKYAEVVESLRPAFEEQAAFRKVEKLKIAQEAANSMARLASMHKDSLMKKAIFEQALREQHAEILASHRASLAALQVPEFINLAEHGQVPQPEAAANSTVAPQSCMKQGTMPQLDEASLHSSADSSQSIQNPSQNSIGVSKNSSPDNSKSSVDAEPEFVAEHEPSSLAFPSLVPDPTKVTSIRSMSPNRDTSHYPRKQHASGFIARFRPGSKKPQDAAAKTPGASGGFKKISFSPLRALEEKFKASKKEQQEQRSLKTKITSETPPDLSNMSSHYEAQLPLATDLSRTLSSIENRSPSRTVNGQTSGSTTHYHRHVSELSETHEESNSPTGAHADLSSEISAFSSSKESSISAKTNLNAQKPSKKTFQGFHIAEDSSEIQPAESAAKPQTQSSLSTSIIGLSPHAGTKSSMVKNPNIFAASRGVSTPSNHRNSRPSFGLSSLVSTTARISNDNDDDDDDDDNDDDDEESDENASPSAPALVPPARLQSSVSAARPNKLSIHSGFDDFSSSDTEQSAPVAANAPNQATVPSSKATVDDEFDF